MTRRFTALATALLVAAVTPAAAPSAPSNPFFTPSTLPFGAPPFDKIKDTDYQPAIEAGMTQQRHEIDAIANNPAAPTFENTIVALEKSGQLLNYASTVFFNVAQANLDPTLEHVEEVEAPKLAAQNDAIYLNQKLFKRVAAVYAKRASLHLDPESQILLKVDYQEFILAGAKLSPAAQTKLRAINQQLASLQTTFENKLLAATAAGGLVVTDKSKLAGLTETQMANAASAAKAHKKSGWMIPLQNTTQQPSLSSLEDRSTREALFNASWTRAERGDANDTRDTIATMAKLRAQKAALLGFPNYATYSLQDQMAKTPAIVQNFLHGLIPPTRKKAASDAAEIQAAIDKSGEHFALTPYDWSFYAEKVRKEKYDFDENEMRPYLELNNVLENGLFYAANKLYGITFKERHDIPVYQKDVRVFEVYDYDGSPLGLMYFDFFKRDNKEGGAWMSNFIQQSKLLHTKPVIYNVENIPKPAPGQPALLTPDEVTGIFHEFGHALNGFFANEEYPSLSGANTSRDFVEFPSQFNEHWAFYPSVLQHYAKNYKTGAPIPAALVAKMKKAETFDTGYSTGELLAADELDMAWHSLSANAPKQNVDAFETKALADSGTDFPNVPPRYRSSYFNHIWAGGYAAGYYAYTWTRMLADDSYDWFVQHGGLTRANGQRFRELILSKGHSLDYGPMFRAFYGKDPDVGPLLDEWGINGNP